LQTSERVSKLEKSVDDMYANIYLWHQLDQGRKAKLQELFTQWSRQVGKVKESVVSSQRRDG